MCRLWATVSHLCHTEDTLNHAFQTSLGRGQIGVFPFGVGLNRVLILFLTLICTFFFAIALALLLCLLVPWYLCLVDAVQPIFLGTHVLK